MTAKIRIRRNVLYRGVLCDIITGRDTHGREVSIACERATATQRIAAKIKSDQPVTSEDFR